MRKVVFVAAVVSMALALPALADTTTLLNVADDGIAAGGPNSNTGKYGFANADVLSSNGERRYLTMWDLSTLPAGAVITSAQVNIFRYSSTDATDGKNFSAYKITSPWTEGHGMSNGGYPVGVVPDGVTWNQAMKETNTNWTTAGGDLDIASRVQFVGATVMDPITGANFGWQFDITAIAQSWLAGSNYGIAICSDETVYQRHAMRTRDYGYPDDGQDRPAPGVYAPRLVLTYTAAPSNHPGDINGDGVVDLQDFGTLKDNFGMTTGGVWATGDLNGDAAIDLQDFGILKDHFGHTNGDSPVTAVPEPATMSLLALAGLGLIRRNRK